MAQSQIKSLKKTKKKANYFDTVFLSDSIGSPSECMKLSLSRGQEGGFSFEACQRLYVGHLATPHIGKDRKKK